MLLCNTDDTEKAIGVTGVTLPVLPGPTSVTFLQLARAKNINKIYNHFVCINYMAVVLIFNTPSALYGMDI